MGIKREEIVTVRCDAVSPTCLSEQEYKGDKVQNFRYWLRLAGWTFVDIRSKHYDTYTATFCPNCVDVYTTEMSMSQGPTVGFLIRLRNAGSEHHSVDLVEAPSDGD